MAAENNLTKEILDSIGEGVFTVDKHLKITFFNRGAESITGFSRNEVVGKFCKYVCNSESCMEKCPIAHVLENGDSIYDYESQMLHKDGAPIPVKLNSSVLYNGDDEPIGGVISFADLSDCGTMISLDKKSQFHGIVAHNKMMHEIFELIEEISDSDASVLIQGESGTGKELIANAIVETSQRKGRPYIKVNCSIFPPQLLASELFGHVKGAFTGAVKDRLGRFELADRGTIFLDEVAEMSLEMQLQLLRVLQEGSFERVGESVARRVDVRVVAATNREIKKALEDGEFREDLYYRLNVIPIEIPPLRDRPDDIPYLVKHFIEKYALRYRKKITEIDDAAMDQLMRYSWPGNVRELENCIEYSFVRTAEEEPIHAAKLPPKIRQAAPSSTAKVLNVSGKKEIELLQLLQKHKWNKTLVARELGIGRTTLWRRMKNMGLDHI